MNKMLLRELKKHKIQTSGIILMIVLWMVIASFLLNIYLHNLDFEKTYSEKTNVEDFNFIPGGTNAANIDELAQRYDFEYESRNSVDFVDKGIDYRVLQHTDKIDKAYIVEGAQPDTADALMINKEYGKAKNIKVGDIISLQDKNYTVTGLFTAPDYLQMHVREGVASYDANSQALVLVNDKELDNFSGDKNYLYVGKFKSDLGDDQKTSLSEKMTLSSDFLYLTFKSDNPNVSFYSAKNSTYKIVTYVTVIVLANIVGLLIVLFLYTSIRNNKKQVGILKANGYSNGQIFFSYWGVALILIVPAAIIGYFGGYGISPYINKILMSDVSVPITGIKLNYVLFGILTLFNVYIALIATLFGVISILKQPVVELMKTKNIKRVTLFERVVFKLYPSKNFRNKIKISFAIRSKLLIFLVIFSAFAAGVEFFMTAIFYQIPNTVQEVQSESMNYENEVYTYQIDKKLDISGQYYYKETGVVGKGSNKTTTKIIGLEDGNLVKLKDGSKDLNGLLKDGAVVNTVLAKNLGIRAGDDLKVQLADKEFTIHVAAISSRVVGKEVFIGRSYLVDNNFIPAKYNGFYTQQADISKSTDKAIVSVVSKKQIIESLENTKTVMQSSSKLLLILGVIIPLVILVIAVSFLIANNKNEIYTLESNGFQKEDIARLIYRSYDIFMILGVLISVPYTYILLSLIFSLAAKAGVYYPIRMDFITIAFGIVMTSIVYFVTLFVMSNKYKSRVVGV